MFDQVSQPSNSLNKQSGDQPKSDNPPASLPTQESPRPQSNQPKSAGTRPAQVEDMFSKTDHSMPQVATPASPGGAVGRSPDPKEDIFSSKKLGQGKSLTIILVIVLVAIVVAAGWFGWNYYQSGDAAIDPSEDVADDNGYLTTDSTSNDFNTDNNLDDNGDTGAGDDINQVDPPEIPLDTDSDGLSDERERELGTDPNNVDTDGDGLIDKSEVDIYKTDPNNSDTDGDGYEDGAEVINGFNPDGPGKLF
jgi:hypothetical protein